MKKFLTLSLLLLIFISCDNSTQKQVEASNTPTVIGTAITENGTTNPILAGDMSKGQIWLDYIQAHNDRDLDKIAEINTEDWMGYPPDGTVINGNDAHIAFLDDWFSSSANPNWTVKWMLADDAKDENGEMIFWLTTGNDITFNDEDGNEVLEHHVHDIQFVDGKISKIYVYSRPAPAE